MKHLFVINPRSFKGKVNQIKDEINKHIINHDGTIYISYYPRSAVGYVRKFVKNANQRVRVYAVGGDGILFDCLNGIAHLKNAELAHIPYGKQNDFIRSFGEGLNDVFRDIDKQMNAPVVSTDIMYCGSNYALNFCSVGVESFSIIVANRIMRFLKYFPKSFVGLFFVFGGIVAILKNSLVGQRYSVNIDGKNFDGCYAGIGVANGNCYGGTLSSALHAMPDDGFIDIMLIKSDKGIRQFSKINDYTQGKYYRHTESIIYVQAKEINVHADNVMYLNLDGETFYDTNFNVKIVPKTINFVSACGEPYKNRNG